jgi:hypothetical protein
MHIWEKETVAEKKAADQDLAAINVVLEEPARIEWELTNAMNRIHVTRNQKGRRAQWRWNKKNGKLVREGKAGGIDWYRYQKQVVIPKFIPFVKECQKDKPGTIIQEDGAAAHVRVSMRKE